MEPSKISFAKYGKWPLASPDAASFMVFTAVNSDGSVVTWIVFAAYIYKASLFTSMRFRRLQIGRDRRYMCYTCLYIYRVLCVYIYRAFAAIRSDGSVVTWGDR